MDAPQLKTGPGKRSSLPERIVMPDLDDSAAAAGRTGENESNSPSRRSVLKGAAGVGAAGIAATTLAGMVTPVASAAVRTPHSAKDEAGGEASSDAIVVHVRNAATGELDIYRGEGETHVRDRELAARIVRATR
jgi:hypothetical protein